MPSLSSSAEHTPSKFKRFVLGLLLLILLLYWDLLLGAIRGLILLLRLPYQDTPVLSEVLRYWGSFSLWILLFLLSTSAFFFLAAFHLLPNLPLEQLLELWKRLWLYLFGRHGSVVFVRNGKILGGVGEQSKKGAGLLVVGPQSAVIVEQKDGRVTHTKVFLEGIVFLKPGQKICGSLDLRPQRRSISDLHAYTKDGVEIITNLSTVFTLGESPEVLLVTYHQDPSQDQLNADSLRVIQLSELPPSPSSLHPLRHVVSSLSDEIDHDDREEIHRFVQNFHRERPENLFPTAQEEEKRSKTSVNPEQILAAFYGIPASQPSQGAMDWTDFPLQIVIDLFREFLASISFESIYSPHRRPTRSLTELKSQFSKRARNQGALCFQFVQRKDNLPIRVGDEWRVSELIFYPVQKLTTPKFLRSKGIKILNATFGELRPADQGFEAQLFDRWLRGYRLQFPDQESTETQSGSEGREHIAQFQKQLAEALELASTSSHTALSRFFTLIEAEIANPWTQKWLGEKTTDKLEQLRKKLLETKTSLPSKEHP